MPMFEARQLSCRKGLHTLFRHLSLQLAAGDILHVRGNNGSGKTSLLRILAGLARAEHGSLWWQGVAQAANGAEQRQRVGWLGLHPGFKDALSAAENLAASQALHRQPPSAEAIRLLLQHWDLQAFAAQATAELSQGQRQRLSLALLQLRAAPLWVLDEPFNALDEPGCTLLWNMLQQHARHGGITILSHHAALPASTAQLWLGSAA